MAETKISDILPPVIDTKLSLPHFPAAWQAVVFRNIGIVPAQRIARALETTVQAVIDSAAEMGLSTDEKHISVWLSKGYITIIKQNWHIVSYRQLLILLDWTREQLAEVLKEDDFLQIKLGSVKSSVDEPKYAELSLDQQNATREIKSLVEKHRTAQTSAPFDFFPTDSGGVAKPERKADNGQFRMLYSYSSLFGDSLLGDSIDNYPTELLKRYKEQGVNAVWMHVVLSQLVPAPFVLQPSLEQEKRLRTLQKTVNKLAAFGIKIFLYFNEPRSMPLSWFDTRPELKGQDCGDGYACLCTSAPMVREYLKGAVKTVFSKVKNLGGMFIITMSENWTNCYSRNSAFTDCPRCKHRSIEEVVAEQNNTIIEGMRTGDPDARAIVFNWGWSEKMTERIVPVLDKDSDFMCVSEDELETDVFGVKGRVVDYSMSNIGPSEKTRRAFRVAGNYGHRCYAKIQANCSWECSFVPYLPVFPLVYRHIANLKNAGATGYMLSWSLGGYPSKTLQMLDYLQRDFDSFPSYEVIMERLFGNSAGIVIEAAEIMSEGFRFFPFCMDTLYFAPHHLGCGNLFFDNPTGFEATMVGFPYDDVQKWKGIYSVQQLGDAYKKMAEGFRRGLEVLNRYTDPSGAVEEVRRYAEAASVHYASAHRQVEFVRIRADGQKKQEARLLLTAEYDDTVRLIRLAAEDNLIGFEASNHYSYTQNSLLEKLLNLTNLVRIYS